MIGRILNWFGTDGLAHVLVSLVLCGVLSAVLPVWGAVLVTMAIGIAKELVWDYWLKKGTCEVRDALSDAIGTILGAFIALLQTL